MSVPWCASSNRPGFCRYAPVKAPFSCPKSSDSRSSPGSAAQLTFTNGLLARDEARWIACATTSLPTPLSPRRSTVAFAEATRETSSRISCIALLIQTSKSSIGPLDLDSVVPQACDVPSSQWNYYKHLEINKP